MLSVAELRAALAIAGWQEFDEQTKKDSSEGAPRCFYWVDVLTVDQHSAQILPQEWWGTTFRDAICRMSHTVMVLSPWDKPKPLTRAWCLWASQAARATPTCE